MPPDDGLPAEEMRAPTEAEWAAMSPEERVEVEERLLTSDSLEQQAQREEAMAEGERNYWGRLSSEVLGLDLLVEEGELRFFLGNAELLGGTRLLRKLQTLADAAFQRAETEARRAESEARRAETEARRAETEAQRAETALHVLATTVLVLLSQRGLKLDAAQEARVRDCRDLSILSRWAARAPEIMQANDLFR